MFASDWRTRDLALKPIHVATVLAALGLPVASEILLVLAFLLAIPWPIAYAVFSPLSFLAILGANLANIVLYLWSMRVRAGPDRFRSLLSIGAVLSGVCLSTVVAFVAILASLGR